MLHAPVGNWTLELSVHDCRSLCANFCDVTYVYVTSEAKKWSSVGDRLPLVDTLTLVHAQFDNTCSSLRAQQRKTRMQGNDK